MREEAEAQPKTAKKASLCAAALSPFCLFTSQASWHLFAMLDRPALMQSASDEKEDSGMSWTGMWHRRFSAAEAWVSAGLRNSRGVLFYFFGPWHVVGGASLTTVGQQATVSRTLPTGRCSVLNLRACYSSNLGFVEVTAYSPLDLVRSGAASAASACSFVTHRCFNGSGTCYLNLRKALPCLL